MVLHVRHSLAEIGREFLTHQNYFHVNSQLPCPPARIPRRSERLEAIDDIDNAIESAEWSLVLLPLEEEDKVLEAYIRDLELIKDMICTYLVGPLAVPVVTVMVATLLKHMITTTPKALSLLYFGCIEGPFDSL